jgi:hypothetical protein
MENNIKLVGEKGDFKVYFNTTSQEYTVFKAGKFLIGNKTKFSQVATYIR